MLEITDLVVSVNNLEIIKGLNLRLPAGEIHAIMGPNGSGKSTLSNTIMGHPNYRVVSGDIRFAGESILGKSPDERARLGIFLSFQYPTSIPGVTVNNFLKTVLKNIRGQEVPLKEFRAEVKAAMEALRMDPDFLRRYVNDGFSGGEKKRHEILQMSLMRPKLAILDETDSGLDIDALRVIAEGIERLRDPARSMLVITHYQRILNYLTIDRVHVFQDGRIIHTGGRELAERLEREGYDRIIAEAGAARP